MGGGGRQKKRTQAGEGSAWRNPRITPGLMDQASLGIGQFTILSRVKQKTTKQEKKKKGFGIVELRLGIILRFWALLQTLLTLQLEVGTHIWNQVGFPLIKKSNYWSIPWLQNTVADTASANAKTIMN